MSVCSNRQRIPDSLEQLNETLNSRTSRIPSAAAQRIQANISSVESLLEDLITPPPAGYYDGLADALASTPNTASEIFPTLRSNLYRTSDDGSILIDSFVSEQEEQTILEFKEAQDQYFEISFLDEILKDSASVQKFRLFLQKHDPQLASGLLTFASDAEIPEDVLSRFSGAHQKYVSENLRSNREVFSKAYALSEKNILTKARANKRWNIVSCQLVDYVNEEAKANYDPQKFGAMVDKTLSLLKEKIYPKLSPETAAFLSINLTKDKFKLHEEKANFTGFQMESFSKSEDRFDNFSSLKYLSSSLVNLKM